MPSGVGPKIPTAMGLSPVTSWPENRTPSLRVLAGEVCAGRQVEVDRDQGGASVWCCNEQKRRCQSRQRLGAAERLHVASPFQGRRANIAPASQEHPLAQRRCGDHDGRWSGQNAKMGVWSRNAVLVPPRDGTNDAERSPVSPRPSVDSRWWDLRGSREVAPEDYLSTDYCRRGEEEAGSLPPVPELGPCLDGAPGLMCPIGGGRTLMATVRSGRVSPAT